jgi:small basic protein
MSESKSASYMGRVLDAIVAVVIALVAIATVAELVKPYVGIAMIGSLCAVAVMFAIRRTRRW